MNHYRVIIARGSKPDVVMHFWDVDSYGAAEQAARECALKGWRAWGIRRVERRGWRTALDYSPPRQEVRRPQVQA